MLFVVVRTARKLAEIKEKLRSSNFRRSKNSPDDDPPNECATRERSIAYGGWKVRISSGLLGNACSQLGREICFFRFRPLHGFGRESLADRRFGANRCEGLAASRGAGLLIGSFDEFLYLFDDQPRVGVIDHVCRNARDSALNVRRERSHLRL